jgi:hypothetical protein
MRVSLATELSCVAQILRSIPTIFLMARKLLSLPWTLLQDVLSTAKICVCLSSYRLCSSQRSGGPQQFSRSNPAPNQALSSGVDQWPGPGMRKGFRDPIPAMGKLEQVLCSDQSGRLLR